MEYLPTAIYKDGLGWYYQPNICTSLTKVLLAYCHPRPALCANHNCFENHGLYVVVELWVEGWMDRWKN